MVDFGTNDMMPHFIYCFGDDWFDEFDKIFKRLKSIILKKMREYGIPSSILTFLIMARRNLITKEKAKEAAEGKLKNDPDWKNYKGSINDDLDSFVNNLQNSEEIDNEEVDSFHTPKLTKKELKLVEQKNKEHMRTYLWRLWPTHEKDKRAKKMVEELEKSDSKDKYVHSRCRRITINVSLESEQTSSDDVSTHDFSENC